MNDYNRVFHCSETSFVEDTAFHDSLKHDMAFLFFVNFIKFCGLSHFKEGYVSYSQHIRGLVLDNNGWLFSLLLLFYILGDTGWFAA